MKIGYCGICILAIICACGGKSSPGSEEVAATATLNIAVTGQGMVTSPDGINCAGNCARPATVGKSVHLDAMPATGMQFMGWSGACSGTGGCDLSISGETQVGASFASQVKPADPCAGIVVPAVTPADLKTFDVSGSNGGCFSAGTDLLGNLYVSTAYGGVVTSTGHTVQNAFLAASLQSGFTSLSGLLDPVPPPVVHYQSYSADGAVLTSFDIPNGPLDFAQNPNGGSVLASGKCDEGRATSTIQLFYFDDANTPTRTAKVTGQGCMGNNLRILVDTAGLTLLVYPNSYAPLFGVPARRSAARWIDASGRPVTDWFDAGPLTGMGFVMQPIIGGGAAIASEDWTFFPSGKAQAAPLPSVLALGGFGFQRIVLGGKAYAVISSTTRAVVAPTGEICGQLPPLGDAMSAFFVGRDGTFMAFSQVQHPCVVSYYPRLLK